MPETKASNAIFTMVHAKFGKLLKHSDYQNLTRCTSVSEVASYLKSGTRYSDAIIKNKTEIKYRGNLEKLSYNTMINDILYLCNFESTIGSDSFQFIMHMKDARLILNFLRYFNSDNVKEFLLDVPAPKDPQNYKLYSSLTLASSLKEIGDVVKTTYFKPLSLLFNESGYSYPLVEINFYKMIFNEAINTAKENLIGREEAEMLDLLFTYIEIRDLHILYRQYHFEKDDVLLPERITISRGHNIHKSTFLKLLNCLSQKEFMEIFMTTSYGAFLKKQNDATFDIALDRFLLKKANHAIHFSRYPCVALLAYILISEVEYSDVATIIEAVRYQYPVKDTEKLLINSIRSD